MKIELEIPDWASASNLWLLMETEPVAYRLKDGDWYVKTGRCSKCGKCCMNFDEKAPLGCIDGHCSYLKKAPGLNESWECGLGLFRPFQCSIATRKIEGCTVSYRKV